MGDKTAISWTDHTFNPVMGCAKVSPGCRNCYAETLLSGRMGRPGLWGRRAARQVTSEANWRKPLKWNREARTAEVRRRVFCGSLCDWAEDHPVANAARSRLWSLIAKTDGLDWLLLTKRSERIAECLPAEWGPHGWPNVWLGVSIETNAYALRADHLRLIPSVVRFVSYEPALGPLDALDLTGIDWLIYGGESGPRYREDDLAWARAMRAKCRAAKTAFFFKQSAAIRPGMGTSLEGETIQEYPSPRPASFII